MELERLAAHELGELINIGKVSAVELTQAYLDRIKQTDTKLGAYITICEKESLKRAERVQQRIDKKESLSPLAGVPVAVKDNICTEGILTTCASKMLYNFLPPYSATVVEKLKSADTILLGKLNMDEFAMGGSTEKSYYKKSKNPWNLERVPGGSSGGSAVSVSAGEAAFALGSDTGGSIRQPASFCSVVGMKPTYGLVSRFGLIAFASSLDQIGPITRDITDCAMVLNTITGHDSKDATSVSMEYPDYTEALVNNVKGMKIGLPKEYIGKGINQDVKKAILDSLKVFETLGAEWEEFSLPLTEYAIPAYYIIASAEASSNLARYDGVKYGYRTDDFVNLQDMYKKTRSEGFGDEVKRRIMLGTYALSSGYYDAYYKKALQVRTLVKENFDKAFEKYDVVIGPTAPTTAYKLGEKTNDPLGMYLGDIYTVSVNIAGLPGLVVPCGFDSENLPIGMQLIGSAFSEKTLLRAGYTFEQNTEFHKRRPGI